MARRDGQFPSWPRVGDSTEPVSDAKYIIKPTNQQIVDYNNTRIVKLTRYYKYTFLLKYYVITRTI